MTAAIVTTISPIIYADDTQPDMLSDNIGGNILHTYARNKNACDDNDTVLFCAVNWIPFIFNIFSSTPQEEDNVVDWCKTAPFPIFPLLRKGKSG